MGDYARGAKLLELRKARRLSREEAAVAIGVTSKALYTWERRNGPIRWENACAAAEFYGVDPDDLVTRKALQDYGDQLARIEAKLDRLLGEDDADARLPGPPAGPIPSDDQTSRPAGALGRAKRSGRRDRP